MCVCVCLSVCVLPCKLCKYPMILICWHMVEDAIYRHLKDLFWTHLVTEKQPCKFSSISRHEICSFLLMSAENTEPLTFVSLKLCLLSFVYCPNECLYSYLWSFVQKFASSQEIWWPCYPHNLHIHDVLLIY